MRTLLTAGLLVTALGGCTTMHRLPMTGCDHVSGWSDQIRAIAVEAYPYAQLAVNAYEDDQDDFRMGPEWVRLEPTHPNNEHGMAYDVWQRAVAGVPGREVVLAFRGTEFSHWSDWRDGNFGTKQNKDGLIEFRAARQRYPDARFTVTGHSLGGGIATQISLSEPNVRSYIFDSSPRFKAPHPPQQNPRVSIVEYGEVLKAARLLGREATQDYYSLNCAGGNPVGQHKSAPLARCLTQIAAWQSENAAASLTLNAIDRAKAANPPGRADCRRR